MLVREAHLPSDPHLHENFARSAKWCAFKKKPTLFQAYY